MSTNEQDNESNSAATETSMQGDAETSSDSTSSSSSKSFTTTKSTATIAHAPNVIVLSAEAQQIAKAEGEAPTPGQWNIIKALHSVLPIIPLFDSTFSAPTKDAIFHTDGEYQAGLKDPLNGATVVKFLINNVSYDLPRFRSIDTMVEDYNKFKEAITTAFGASQTVQVKNMELKQLTKITSFRELFFPEFLDAVQVHPEFRKIADAPIDTWKHSYFWETLARLAVPPVNTNVQLRVKCLAALRAIAPIQFNPRPDDKERVLLTPKFAKLYASIAATINQHGQAESIVGLEFLQAILQKLPKDLQRHIAFEFGRAMNVKEGDDPYTVQIFNRVTETDDFIALSYDNKKTIIAFLQAICIMIDSSVGEYFTILAKDEIRQYETYKTSLPKNLLDILTPTYNTTPPAVKGVKFSTTTTPPNKSPNKSLSKSPKKNQYQNVGEKRNRSASPAVRITTEIKRPKEATKSVFSESLEAWSTVECPIPKWRVDKWKRLAKPTVVPCHQHYVESITSDKIFCILCRSNQHWENECDRNMCPCDRFKAHCATTCRRFKELCDKAPFNDDKGYFKLITAEFADRVLSDRRYNTIPEPRSRGFYDPRDDPRNRRSSPSRRNDAPRRRSPPRRNEAPRRSSPLPRRYSPPPRDSGRTPANGDRRRIATVAPYYSSGFLDSIFGQNSSHYTTLPTFARQNPTQIKAIQRVATTADCTFNAIIPYARYHDIPDIAKIPDFVNAFVTADTGNTVENVLSPSLGDSLAKAGYTIRTCFPVDVADYRGGTSKITQCVDIPHLFIRIPKYNTFTDIFNTTFYIYNGEANGTHEMILSYTCMNDQMNFNAKDRLQDALHEGNKLHSSYGSRVRTTNISTLYYFISDISRPPDDDKSLTICAPDLYIDNSRTARSYNNSALNTNFIKLLSYTNNLPAFSTAYFPTNTTMKQIHNNPRHTSNYDTTAYNYNDREVTCDHAGIERLTLPDPSQRICTCGIRDMNSRGAGDFRQSWSIRHTHPMNLINSRAEQRSEEMCMGCEYHWSERNLPRILTANSDLNCVNLIPMLTGCIKYHSLDNNVVDIQATAQIRRILSHTHKTPPIDKQLNTNYNHLTNQEVHRVNAIQLATGTSTQSNESNETNVNPSATDIQQKIDNVFHSTMQKYQTDYSVIEPLDSNDKSTLTREELLKQKLTEGYKNVESLISESDWTSFTNMIYTYESTMVTSLRPEPARVPPFKVVLKEGAMPKKIQSGILRGEAGRQMTKHNQDLIDAGIVTLVADARWLARASMVPKPGSTTGELRQIIDHRYLNSNTVPIQGYMPLAEDVIPQFAGSRFYAVFDFQKGFYQLMLDKESQDKFCYSAMGNMYKPSRLIQGSTDSPNYFQNCISLIAKPLIDEGGLALWVDDTVIHGKTWQVFQRRVTDFLIICLKYNFQINLKKSCLANTEARWNGRIINATGVRLSPRNEDDFRNCTLPLTGGALSAIVMGCSWLRNCLPCFSANESFAGISAPLWQILDKVYALAKSNKRKRYEKIRLADAGWNQTHTDAFNKLKQLLHMSVQNAFIPPNAKLHLFTDASDNFYAGILTFVHEDEWDSSIPIDEIYKQKHVMAAMLSGQFKGSQLNWRIMEKEAFALIECLTKWPHHLLLPQGFTVWNDHRNIVDIYKPENARPAFTKMAMNRIYNWLYLMAEYKILDLRHIEGTNNVWADILSRELNCANNNEGAANSRIQRLTIRAINKPIKRKAAMIPQRHLRRDVQQYYLNMSYPINKSKTEQVNVATILISQTNLSDIDTTFHSEHIDHFSTGEDGLLLYDNRYWIPHSDLELLVRICIGAHCSDAGHRSIEVTLSYIQSYCWSFNLKQVVSTFCNSCLVCLKAKNSGRTVPRPFGNTLVATKRGEVLIADFYYVTKALPEWDHTFQWVLILKDGFTKFVMFYLCSSPSGPEVVDSILEWVSLFTAPKYLVSDRGSHFKNTLVHKLCRYLDIDQSFTLAYCAWAHGSVERTCRELKALIKVLSNDKKVKDENWIHLIPGIQSVCINTPSKSLGNYSPKQLMLGFDKYNPLTSNFDEELTPYLNIEPTDHSKMIQDHYNRLIQSIHTWSDEATTANKKRKRVNDSQQSNKRNVRAYRAKEMGIQLSELTPDNILPRFIIGDYVLMAVPNIAKLHKLEAYWRGPYRITGYINDYAYRITHLVSQVEHEAHIVRLQFYCDGDLDLPVPLLDELNREVHYASLYDIDHILRFIYDDVSDSYSLEIKWLGFSALENTFEPFSDIAMQQPKLIAAYLRTLPPEDATTKDMQKLLLALLD